MPANVNELHGLAYLSATLGPTGATIVVIIGMILFVWLASRTI